jgi:Zn-dependent oligopeptidase
MAKNTETVFAFLDRLVERLEPAFQLDMKTLLALKRKDNLDSGVAFDGRMQSWDWRYYQNLVLENDYSINAEEIREYFPMDHVLAGMLDIFQEILSLRFEEVVGAVAHVWHPEVRQFSVFDRTSGNFVGHFYLDLHPREGKYGHAAEFGLQKGCFARGARQAPAAAMVANFSKATSDRPSLLDHDEVVTLFHEFGHVMHELMSTYALSPARIFCTSF